MIKIIIFAIVVMGILGIWSYQDSKVTIDTAKGKAVYEKSRDFVKEHVEVK